MELSKILRGIRLIGWKPVIRVASYSLYRDRLNLPLQRYDFTPGEIQPGRLVETTSKPDGAYFIFQNARLEIRFLADDLVHLTWNPNQKNDQFPSYTLAQHDWLQITPKYKETIDGPQISSKTLGVLVQEDGYVRYISKHGITLREEYPPVFLTDDKLGLGAGWIHKARLKPEASIYGLGERSTALDRRGGQFEMWNTDPGGSYSSGMDPLYTGIPVYQVQQADGGFLVFYDNSYRASFTFNNNATASFQGGPLRFYFIPGNPSQTLERYSELTGRPEMPPIWALGYHQSRWSYKSEAEIRTLAGEFRKCNLLISSIHLDIDYMQGFRIFTVNNKEFPDLAGLAYDLAQNGVHLVAILDPGVKMDKKYFLYQSGVKEDVFCKDADGEIVRGLAWPGWAAFPDFTKEASRKWWGDQSACLLEQGISGFWYDMNEPSSFSGWGDQTLPLTTQHDMDGHPKDHRLAHNLYGLQMARAGFEGLQRLRSQRRPWIVTRSGWAGIQRYAWSWTGDIETSWDALRMTIPTILGLGLSGQPYSGSDIGGFSGNPDAELYLRWFQMSAFFPFFRTHSASDTERREPWLFGETATNIIRNYLNLRYQLMPYFYTLAWESTQKGIPLVRPLFWLDPEDSRLWQVDDAFLLGEDLLIAPVLEAGATTRQIILPSCCWYDFWDGSMMEGPGKAIVATSLDNIPVFVRDGSLLPLEKDGNLELHLYPQESSHSGGRIYSDAGDGYGPYRLDHFIIERGENEISIDWQSTGEFPFPYQEVFLHVHNRPTASLRVDGREINALNGVFQTGVFNRGIVDLS